MPLRHIPLLSLTIILDLLIMIRKAQLGQGEISFCIAPSNGPSCLVLLGCTYPTYQGMSRTGMKQVLYLTGWGERWGWYATYLVGKVATRDRYPTYLLGYTYENIRRPLWMHYLPSYYILVGKNILKYINWLGSLGLSKSPEVSEGCHRWYSSKRIWGIDPDLV